MYEYSLYERLQFEESIAVNSQDVHMSIWEETKYYPFVDQEKSIPCDFGCDTAAMLNELRQYASTEKETKP